MTLQDIYSAVSQLGFEDSLGDDSIDRFIYAANRALTEIDSLRPRCKRFEINHRMPDNILFSAPTCIEKTEELTFSAYNAKSFYFETAGEGSYEVWIKCIEENSNGEITERYVRDTFRGEITPGEITFKSPNSATFITHQGFIKYDEAFIDRLIKRNAEEENRVLSPGETKTIYTGEAVIIFKGDYDYTVRNLAMYDKVYSSNENDIVPYGHTVKYHMPSIIPDFGKFDSLPIEASGDPLYEGYDFENNDTVCIPYDRTCCVTIKYIHKVEKISKSADVTSTQSEDVVNIDLEDDLAELLPVLIATYVWLDDEPEKSQYYYNLYLQRAEQIKRAAKDLNPIKFESVNGW